MPIFAITGMGRNSIVRRFFGMMPSSEVKIRKHYKDEYGLIIRIDAGDHGWTILYADGSTNYKDVDDTPENNFKSAYEVLSSHFSSLEEIVSDTENNCCMMSAAESDSES